MKTKRHGQSPHIERKTVQLNISSLDLAVVHTRRYTCYRCKRGQEDTRAENDMDPGPTCTILSGRANSGATDNVQSYVSKGKKGGQRRYKIQVPVLNFSQGFLDNTMQQPKS